MRIAAFMILLLISPTILLAQEKTLDEQYQSVAAARTRAELAIRKARSYFEETDNRWRSAAHGTEQARAQTMEGIRRAIEDEQRKPEEMRSQPVIEDLNQRRAQIEQDWQRYAAVDRPTIDASWRLASQAGNNVAQVYQQMTSIEPGWKGSEVDIKTLESIYDAITKRADAIRDQAAKALGDLQASQKMWENVAAAATQPARK
jgi:hypothetical protein